MICLADATNLGHSCHVASHLFPLRSCILQLGIFSYSLEEHLSSKLPELTTTSTRSSVCSRSSRGRPTSSPSRCSETASSGLVQNNLYAEPKKLIAHGYASTHPEPRGKRPRTVYTITPSGRQALHRLAQTPAAEPRWEAESMVKFHFATGSTKEQLLANVHEFRQHAVARWQAVAEIFRPYLEGNEPFPNRTHLNVIPEDSSSRPHAAKPNGQTEQSKKSKNGTHPRDPKTTRQRSPHSRSRSPPEPPESQPQASVALLEGAQGTPTRGTVGLAGTGCYLTECINGDDHPLARPLQHR